MIYKRKTHTVKIVVAAVLIAGSVGAYTFSRSDFASAQSSNLEIKASDLSNVGSVDGPGLISIVDKIESIKLDGSVFNDKVFVSLEDQTVTLPVPVIGRNNPFAPIGSSQTTAASKTTTSGR